MFRILIVCRARILSKTGTQLHATAIRTRLYSPHIFSEMTVLNEENPQVCTKKFLCHLDFLLPSNAQFSSLYSPTLSFST